MRNERLFTNRFVMSLPTHAPTAEACLMPHAAKAGASLSPHSRTAVAAIRVLDSAGAQISDGSSNEDARFRASKTKEGFAGIRVSLDSGKTVPLEWKLVVPKRTRGDGRSAILRPSCAVKPRQRWADAVVEPREGPSGSGGRRKSVAEIVLGATRLRAADAAC
jgi:hypothetical protein